MPSPSPSPHDSGALDHRFRELADAYSAELKQLGTRCIPYRDPALPLFSKTGVEKKLSAIAFLENALAVFAEVRTAGGNPRDNRTLIWRTLNRLKLIPDSSIFDKLTDDDVVEIYSLPDHLHLAWNIHFLDRVSFTAEQLLCQPWWELSTRPAEIISEFQRLALLLVSGECTETLTSPVPPHQVQELQSHELLTLNMEIRYVSPLRRSGTNVGFLVVTRSQITGSLRAV